MATKQQFWTHPSVARLTNEADPVSVVTRLARELALRAIDQGWNGPPFDPVELASLLNYSIVPREDVAEARTVAVNDDQLQIEYNPNRPRGRCRYSIAHELAHTLFPDCKERVRHRLAREEMTKDDWQLEMLCNIGAAELLMPIGSFPDLKQADLSIDVLMKLRQKFDVSSEALLLRVVRLTELPCFMFCASRRELSSGSDRYVLDYMVGSRSWKGSLPSGAPLPTNSAVRECTAIGFTAKADEVWPGITGGVHLECVGIASYPGHRYPRVVGFGTQPTAAREKRNTVTYLRGDATQPRGNGVRMIVHVVNDRTPNWGGGFALAVRRRYPEVQAEFIEWWRDSMTQSRLGSTHVCRLSQDLAVTSLVAQHGLGPSREARIRYGALETCLESLASEARAAPASIHMPRIGCGQAGGSWEVVEELIQTCLIESGVSVTVYDLPDQSPPVPRPASLFE